jgi:MYXO-CTERM domain-containing protein
MRSVTSLFALSLLIVASGSLVGCAPADDGDETGGSQQNVTGGSHEIESSVVYLFEDAPTKKSLPKCVGALLGKKVAVTAKSCAKQGMFIGRAAEKDGRRTRATITEVHVPEAADADIAVVEIDREIGGTRAVITHAPLRDGYSINSYASADGDGLFGALFAPDKGEAASIDGRLTSETEMHSTIFPKKGARICAGDIGAPVCSSTSKKAGNINFSGTCGLSGIIVGPDTSASGNDAQNPASGGAAASTCSAGAWKVVQLGRYADFLREFAPEAFKPLTLDLDLDFDLDLDLDLPFDDMFALAPPGLWGYKSGGNVATCKIETTKLDPIAVGAETKLTARVSFASMESLAAPAGRFGIAPKSAPTKMRWLPARATSQSKGSSFQTSFEGVVSALTEGDYVVAFRASANGGESWTQCDVDGIENGFSTDKALELKVGAVGSSAPSGAEPQNTPPPAPAADSSESDYSDLPRDESSDESSDDEDEGFTRKKKKSSSSCSASPGSTGTSTGLPMLGVLLGAAALVRRRR